MIVRSLRNIAAYQGRRRVGPEGAPPPGQGTAGHRLQPGPRRGRARPRRPSPPAPSRPRSTTSLEGRGLMRVGEEQAELGARGRRRHPSRIESNRSRTSARATWPFSASSIRPGGPRTKRSSDDLLRRLSGLTQDELEAGLRRAEVSQLPALVLGPDRLPLRHLDGGHRPRLPGLRPDQIPGLSRPRRVRARASRPGCSCSTRASSPTACPAGRLLMSPRRS